MGFPLERQYGWRRIAIAYFVTGICGNLFSVALAPCKLAVGASTAGFGLIGIQVLFRFEATGWIHLADGRDRFNLARSATEGTRNFQHSVSGRATVLAWYLIAVSS